MIDPETKVITKIPEEVQNQLLQNNGKRLREIELDNKVIVDIDVLTRSVSIQGNELEVVLAKSIIDELKDKHTKAQKPNQHDINELACQMAKISINNNVKNFALKLGYTENDIALAANKCIENDIRPDGDAILKELTKQNPQKTLANEANNSAAADAVFFQEEFVTKTVAEHTSELSTSDETDLRGIVIDGSNIAMW